MLNMANKVLMLPPELLGHIFRFLSDTRADISACRLVCKAFKDCSSPFLITKIVFAARLKEITRFQEILEHPYYPRYITELVYDTSYYDKDVAYNWNRYVAACTQGPRIYRDDEWEERNRRDEASITRIKERSGFQTSLQEERAQSSDNMNDYYNFVYRLGCHKGLPDYNRLLKAQNDIRRAELPHRLLHQALTKLLALRSVVLTDWRGLSKPGESYDQCARRLFGNTLEPKCLTPKTSNDCGLDLMTILWAIEDNPQACIESFETGRHLFEHKQEIYHDPLSIFEGRRMICIDASHINDFPAPLNSRHFMQNLRRLDLSVRIGEECFRSSTDYRIGKILQEASALTYLRLHMEICSRPIEPAGLKPFIVDGSPGQKFFGRLLTDLVLPKLRTIHLQNWPLPRISLQQFLANHAATLREVRLIDCFLDEDGEGLAQWTGNKMHLNGVVLQGSFGIPLPPGEEDGSLETQEHIWLRGRQNFAQRERTTEFVGYSDGAAVGDDGKHPWWMEKRIWR